MSGSLSSRDLTGQILPSEHPEAVSGGTPTLMPLQQSVYRLAERPDGFDVVKENSFRFPTFALGQIHAQQNHRAAGDDPQCDLLPKQPCPQKRGHNRLEVREGCHA